MERKLAYNLCSPVLPQIALADFLASGAYDAHLRRIRHIFEENLARMTRAIEASFPADTKVSRPAGGFMLWLELPRRFDTRFMVQPRYRSFGVMQCRGHTHRATQSLRNGLRRPRHPAGTLRWFASCCWQPKNQGDHVMAMTASNPERRRVLRSFRRER